MCLDGNILPSSRNEHLKYTTSSNFIFKFQANWLVVIPTYII